MAKIARRPANKYEADGPDDDDGEDTESVLAIMREQLDTLAVALESSSPSVPATPDQWRRCLKEIAKGVDWRYRTWP